MNKICQHYGPCSLLQELQLVSISANVDKDAAADASAGDVTSEGQEQKDGDSAAAPPQAPGSQPQADGAADGGVCEDDDDGNIVIIDGSDDDDASQQQDAKANEAAGDAEGDKQQQQDAQQPPAAHIEPPEEFIALDIDDAAPEAAQQQQPGTGSKSSGAAAAAAAKIPSSKGYSPPWMSAIRYINSPSLRLHTEIVHLCNLLNASEAEAAQRQQAVDDISEVVTGIWPGATVEVFGSFSTGLYTPTSDIDLVVMNSHCGRVQVSHTGGPLTRGCSRGGQSARLRTMLCCHSCHSHPWVQHLSFTHA